MPDPIELPVPLGPLIILDKKKKQKELGPRTPSSSVYDEPAPQRQLESGFNDARLIRLVFF